MYTDPARHITAADTGPIANDLYDLHDLCDLDRALFEVWLFFPSL